MSAAAAAAAASPADLCAFVLARGREGLARVEIAAALGVTLARLEAVGRACPAVAEALALADEAAEAWWLALPRRAGKGLNGSAWRAAMEWRFGRSGGGARGAQGAASSGATSSGASASGAASKPAAGRRPSPPPAPRVIFNIPSNGRERRPWRPEPPGEDADWVERAQFWIDQRNFAEGERRQAVKALNELGWRGGRDEEEEDDDGYDDEWDDEDRDDDAGDDDAGADDAGDEGARYDGAGDGGGYA